MTESPTGRRRRGASRQQIAVRRGIAVAVLVGAFGVLAWIAARALGGDDEAPPPPTTVAVAPAPKPLRIVFPEGFTRAQMAERITAVNGIAKRRRNVTPKLSAKRYLAVTGRGKWPPPFAKKKGPLEGFLFPAVYEFTPKTTSKQLVDDQLEAFRRNWAKVDLGYARSKNLTPYDVLVIASMVERETAAPEERRLVAAVIYNRLEQGMPLGIDATIRYGLDVPPTEALRRSQLESDNPYNTRRFTGLPPTPIANPGLASIKAAANPARKDFLFFVRKPDEKHHFFTASEQEFLRKTCEYGYGCS